MKEFYGDSHVWLAGSHMYRTNVSTSDEDYIGVEFSPRNIVDPFTKSDETVVQGEMVKHSETKFAKLLVKGNPTTIDLVHHDPVQSHPFVQGLVTAVRPYVLTSAAIRSYLGYLGEQKRRGFKQQRKHGHRPEEELLGYDPKYLGHCFRIGTILQNIYSTGEYHYLTESEVQHVRHLRSGTVPEDEALAHIEDFVGGLVEGINPDRFPPEDMLRERIRGYFLGNIL